MLWERFLRSPGLGVLAGGTQQAELASRSAGPSQPGSQESSTEFFNVCPLSPFSLTCPTSVPPPWEHHRRWSFSLVCSAFLLPLLSQMCQGLLLMTFLSVFQIVSNKSIPRKRPREVALSTFQTFFLSLFPPPLFLLPFSSPVTLVQKPLGQHGGRSSGPSVMLHSSRSRSCLSTAWLPQTSPQRCSAQCMGRLQ